MTTKIMINNKETDGSFLLRQHVDRGVQRRRALSARFHNRKSDTQIHFGLNTHSYTSYWQVTLTQYWNIVRTA